MIVVIPLLANILQRRSDRSNLWHTTQDLAATSFVLTIDIESQG